MTERREITNPIDGERYDERDRARELPEMPMEGEWVVPARGGMGKASWLICRCSWGVFTAVVLHLLATASATALSPLLLVPCLVFAFIAIASHIRYYRTELQSWSYASLTIILLSFLTGLRFYAPVELEQSALQLTPHIMQAASHAKLSIAGVQPLNSSVVASKPGSQL